MIVRNSQAEWRGDLKGGAGTIKLGSGAYEGQYSFNSRFAEGAGTNPEEMLAAAHAGCYSMALSHELASAGFTPTSVHTVASVNLEAVEGGFGVTGIKLTTDAVVPGITDDQFQEIALAAKVGCPISKALASVPILLLAKLIEG